MAAMQNIETTVGENNFQCIGFPIVT